MIPKLEDAGGPWKTLPPGIHGATLEEIEKRYAYNDCRNKLFKGFKRAAKALRKAKCTHVYLDGSFVSDKPKPEDFDACWDPINVKTRKLDKVLLDFDNMRANQKKRFGGELFLASGRADAKHTYLDYFQISKHTGKKKGILKIRLQGQGKRGKKA